jgi:Domain of unknown function (DUF4424)
MSRLLPALLAATALTLPARANDSEAETPLGGLILKQSDAITLEREDLMISRDHVRVAYRFVNTSDKPVETLVAFPLPDIPADDDENLHYWSRPPQVEFKTTVDGRPVDYDIVQQAIYKGEDVTARLTALHLPLNRFAPEFDKALAAAPKTERDRLVAQGLLHDEGGGAFSPRWALRVSMTRQQVFAPHAPVAVTHEYRPLIGGAVAGGLDPGLRDSADFREKTRRYCIEKDWLASFDRLVARRRGEVAPYSEVWIGYVLKSGANWKGPIGDFHLVVDKGRPDSLVSFCAEGVKKITSTRFEARYENFTPRDDLDILIVDWPR